MSRGIARSVYMMRLASRQMEDKANENAGHENYDQECRAGKFRKSDVDVN